MKKKLNTAVVILFRKPVTKIPKRIFREFNRIDFFGLTLQLRNRQIPALYV